MKVIVFDTKSYDRQFLDAENAKYKFKIKYLESKLTPDTAQLARGYDVACAFVNDDLGADTIDALAAVGVKNVAMRCAGYNNVDIKHAFNKMRFVRVPRYSPYAVAEHAMALLLTLNRRTHRAYIRTRDGNFSLNGLLGFDLHGKTIGVIGTGQIGQCFINICKGFGMRVLAYDPFPQKDASFEYAELDQILHESDIISLHCPLTPETKHIIDARAIDMLKAGAIIINTSRGALIDTKALIGSLKTGHIAGAGLDVYEEESDIFFEDHSDELIQDDQLLRLLSFNNVIVTSHQAFFTKEALEKIAQVTLFNIDQIAKGVNLENEICYHCDRKPADCLKKQGKNCFEFKD